MISVSSGKLDAECAFLQHRLSNDGLIVCYILNLGKILKSFIPKTLTDRKRYWR